MAMDHPPRGEIGVRGKEEEGSGTCRVPLLDGDVAKEEQRRRSGGLVPGGGGRDRSVWRRKPDPAFRAGLRAQLASLLTE
ncbi:hypothetical protein C2845_PM01G05650 [Panicum miliaceum]|uniref:Uncharacterized protein n=1 Tax=Panicum miliaceum TaxID=4540 RepID=A0A3L6TPX4_PANMI|nr:hypothetical protein C2845_PM01G05650 [Panicum miliaceum]